MNSEYSQIIFELGQMIVNISRINLKINRINLKFNRFLSMIVQISFGWIVKVAITGCVPHKEKNVSL